MRKNSPIQTTHWKTKYIVGLGLIAVVLLGGQILLRQFLEQQKFDITILHTATNQRFLSQNIAKEASVIVQKQEAEKHLPKLKRALQKMQEAHQNLTQHSNSLGFNEGYKNSKAIKLIYDSLQPYYIQLVMESENFALATTRQDFAKQRLALERIWESETHFERLMDKAVDVYDAEDNAKMMTLRWLEWSMIILSTLAMILGGFFVFRPIINKANAAFIELEANKNEISATEEEVRQNLEEMKTIQEALSEAYSEMNAINNALNRGTIVSMGDLRGNILKVNEAFCEIAKFSEDELIGKNHSVVNSGYHPKEFWITLWKTISRGDIWHGEIKNKAKDGSFYWVDAVISPVLDKYGNIAKYLSVRTLITAKKAAEEALKEANEELQQNMEELKSTQEAFQRSYADMQAMMTALNNSAIVSLSDLKGDIIFANDEFCRVSQYTRAELLGRNHSLINSGYHSKEHWKEFWRTISRGGTWVGEVRNKSKDGSFYWVYAVVTPVYDNNGKIYKYLSVRTLITERKEAETRLQRTQQQLLQTYQIARIGFWEVDLDLQTIYWSPVAKEIHEVAPDFEPSLATGITFFKKGENREKMSRMMSKSIQDGTPWDLELQIVTAKGRDVWVHTKGEVEFVEGEPARLFGTFQDIDEKKRNELAIQKLAYIVENSEDAIASIDFQYNVLSWNKGAEHLFGYTAEELIGVEGGLLKLIPSEQGLAEENLFLEQVRLGFNVEHYETVRRTKAGNTLYLSISVSPIRDGEGNIIGASKIARDITSKKLFEQELMQKNEDIISSINYAQRIQNSILPLPEEISEVMPEHFILFKPRDIVSGDFYYFERQHGKAIFAVVDCTGHGVPGAFMSMLGFATLNEIILNLDITEPNRVLEHLHKNIRKTLKQAETNNRDGMDLAMLVWDKEKNLVEYAGAKNPLVYVHRNEAHLIKADAKGIGGEQLEQERLFTKHVIDLHDIGEVMFYLYSDGYQDQFGGAQAKKFSLKRLKDVFVGIHCLDMATQRQKLDQTFEDWRAEAGERQIDDVLVMGVRLGR